MSEDALARTIQDKLRDFETIPSSIVQTSCTPQHVQDPRISWLSRRRCPQCKKSTVDAVGQRSLVCSICCVSPHEMLRDGSLGEACCDVTACRPGKPAGKLLRQPSSNRCSSGGVEGSGVQAHVKQVAVAASGMTQFRYQNHFNFFFNILRHTLDSCFTTRSTLFACVRKSSRLALAGLFR